MLWSRSGRSEVFLRARPIIVRMGITRRASAHVTATALLVVGVLLIWIGTSVRDIEGQTVWFWTALVTGVVMLALAAALFWMAAKS